MEDFQPKKISFQPLDLKKALVNKPRGSKISFKGIGNDALEFAMPARSMNFYDYVVMAWCKNALATIRCRTYIRGA